MARALSVLIVLCATVAVQALNHESHVARGSVGAEQERSLLQTYNNQLSGSSSSSKGVTPVTRVVNLLKEMSATLNKEQEEDEALYDKLACWCNNNKYEKTGSSDAANAKISDLEASIEMLTARSKELNTKIKELEAEVAADKAALAEATALRQKQLKEFHGMELTTLKLWRI
jgi:septal ring factor EnvC (AmiA/AmiB activator)